jgi:SPP1 family predicted phage head-tail adaptor
MAKQTPLQAGDLDRKIKLFRRSGLPLPERDGAGQIVARGNEPYAVVPAMKGKQAGKEQEILNQDNAVSITPFTIRYRSDVLNTDELECDGETYQIIDTAEGEGRRQWTVIKAQKVSK